MAAGPVSRILSALRQDDHSSGPRITAGLKRPTRRLWRAEPARAPPPLQTLRTDTKNAQSETLAATANLPPYLVLLRVGFALPAALLPRRCALTAPFHPYLAVVLSLRCGLGPYGSVLDFRAQLRTHNDDEAVCFLWHFPSNRLEPAVPDVIRHTALRSSDFPLPCDSDRPVRLPTKPIIVQPEIELGFGEPSLN